MPFLQPNQQSQSTKGSKALNGREYDDIEGSAKFQSNGLH